MPTSNICLKITNRAFVNNKIHKITHKFTRTLKNYAIIKKIRHKVVQALCIFKATLPFFKMQNTKLLRNLYSKNVLTTARNISVSSARLGSFKVQDDKEFMEKVQKSKEPVIVDFFATWCGPCRALTPRLENVIAKRNGKVNLAKVDIDDLGELAAKFQVSTIPALVCFRNGKVTERLVGLQDEDKLDNWIAKVTSEKK